MLKQQRINVSLGKKYLKILEIDIYVIVKNIDAWQNSRKMNESKVSVTNYKLIKEFWG